MGRVKKPPSSPPDLTNFDSTLAEYYGSDYAYKHRSCWIHIVAYLHRHKKKITWQEIEEIRKKYRRSSPCCYRKFPHDIRSADERQKWKPNSGQSKQMFKGGRMFNGERSCRMARRAMLTTKANNKMDTGKFENYMESIWKRFPEDKRMSFGYLDSLWFSLYRDLSMRSKVLSWIKQKCIFSKKYVFVPIVCWDHWSLLIFVHLGESSNSKTRTPCMLLLDSLENADPRRVEPDIRKFVVDIYRAEGRMEDKKVISRIPFLVPKVPQQRNDEECGNYVLYFINLFMANAPENFSISDGYPYFMLQNWFNPKDLENFYDKLEKEPATKKPNTITTCVSRPKLQKKDGVISVDD